MQEQEKFQDKANGQISIDIDVMIFFIRKGRKKGPFALSCEF